ncbi:MAG: nuclear transport factor 2 family protein [Rhodanobacter sp.]
MLQQAIRYVAIIGCIALTATPAHSVESAQTYLVSQERASWTLAIDGKAEAYKTLHAADFYTVGADGFHNKADSEASALDPHVKFDHCDLTDFKVTSPTPDTALISYHVKAGGTDHGKAFAIDQYATSLWASRNGKWINVFYQATPHQ